MLLSTLLRAIVAPDDPSRREALLSELRAASPGAWRETASTLRIHRLEPLAWRTLKHVDAVALLPAQEARELEASHLRCFLQNGRAMNALDRILEAWSARGIEPVLLKGAALLNSIYPGLGSRPMEDVDVYLAPERLPEGLAALSELGFAQRSAQEDTLSLSKDSVLTLDLHHRLRIFDGRSLTELSVSARPRFLAAPAVRILEPNALVVHLVAHLEGHRGETGFVLGWLLDLGLVFDARSESISSSTLRALARDEPAHRAIRRVAGFVERVLGSALPKELERETDEPGALTLERALGTRRAALWGLPRPMGWLRLAAHCSGLRKYPARPLPKWKDLWSRR